MDHLEHQRMRPLGFNLRTGGWDKRGHRAKTWGGFQGQVAGTGTWGGFNGQGGWDWDMGGFRRQAWWVRTRESDLQGLTWGHGTGTRVRLLGGTTG